MKYYLTLLAAALMLVACNKENGGEPLDPNTTKVSFENIADLDIEKTTWVITGEATEEQWLTMIEKMYEIQDKGEEYYGTIDVVMPDITECPNIRFPFLKKGATEKYDDTTPNYVLKSFSAPNMTLAGYYLLSNCRYLVKANLPKLTQNYYYRDCREMLKFS